MLTKTELQTTSAYAFLADPADKTRAPDFHVNYVEIKTHSDGERIVSAERQCNSAEAARLGLSLGSILEGFNVSIAAERDTLRGECEALRGEIETLTEQKADSENRLVASEQERQRILSAAQLAALAVAQG